MSAAPQGRASSAPRYTATGAALHQLLRELERFAQEGLALGRLSSVRLALLHSAMHGEKTASELARERGASRQATLRVVDSLLAEGWLERAPNPRHRRAPLLRATPLGRRTYFAAAHEEAAALNSLAEHCAYEEVAAALKLLRTIREHATRG
ncbi:MAG: winged helix-turn-helix transcriptional regulator [Deltaproteobacteria bacterium]|nr:winged helix-turn-helix transcriptional regulator [Deltaproteobacteria bacterium]